MKQLLSPPKLAALKAFVEDAGLTFTDGPTRYIVASEEATDRCETVEDVEASVQELLRLHYRGW